MPHFGFTLIFMAALGVSGYAIATYLGRPLGVGVHPKMQAAYEAHRLIIYTHIFASCVALAVGPLQFITWIRQKSPHWHRFLGKLYLLVGVGVGGISSLYVATFAYGGLVSTLGFGILGIGWLYTGYRAYAAARAKDIATHKRWMIRNYALTFAAVTIRVGIGLGFAMQLPFSVFYPALSWLCWIVNVTVVEVLLLRGNGNRTVLLPNAKPTKNPIQ